jgi:hypothetical protein
MTDMEVGHPGGDGTTAEGLGQLTQKRDISYKNRTTDQKVEQRTWEQDNYQDIGTTDMEAGQL